MERNTFWLAFVLMMFACTLTANAQDSSNESDIRRQQHFYFVYVAPDRAVDKRLLRAELNKIADDIIKKEDPAIFYLANGTKPIIVKFNIGEKNHSDYTEKFDYMLNNNNSWTIDSPYDVAQIQELFKKYNFIDDKGQLIYNVTEIDFHVGKVFWDQKCNEVLISKLYFELNAVKFNNNPAFRFNVYLYCPPAQDNIDRENKFGELNPDGINQNVNIQRKQTL